MVTPGSTVGKCVHPFLEGAVAGPAVVRARFAGVAVVADVERAEHGALGCAYRDYSFEVFGGAGYVGALGDCPADSLGQGCWRFAISQHLARQGMRLFFVAIRTPPLSIIKLA